MQYFLLVVIKRTKENFIIIRTGRSTGVINEAVLFSLGCGSKMSSNSPRSPIENTASSDAGVVTDDVVVSTALGNLGLSETNKETFVPLNEEQGCPMEVEVENLQVAPLTHEEARKALQEETELLNNKNTYVATLMAQKRRLGENAAIDISISTAIAEIQKKDAQVKQWQSIVMGFESVARTQRCLEPVISLSLLVIVLCPREQMAR